MKDATSPREADKSPGYSDLHYRLIAPSLGSFSLTPLIVAPFIAFY